MPSNASPYLITLRNYPVRYRAFGWAELTEKDQLLRRSNSIAYTKVKEGKEFKSTTTSLNCGWWVTDQLRYALETHYPKLALVEYTRYHRQYPDIGDDRVWSIRHDERTIDIKPIYIFPVAALQRKYFDTLAEAILVEYYHMLKPEIQQVLQRQSTNLGVLNQQWYTEDQTRWEITRIVQSAIAQAGIGGLWNGLDARRDLCFNYDTMRGSQRKARHILAETLFKVDVGDEYYKDNFMSMLSYRYQQATYDCFNQPQPPFAHLL